MKKFLSLILSVLFCVIALAGCSFVEHDYEKDYSQVIAVIDVPTQTVTGKRVVFDAKGYPTYDLYGKPVYEDVEKQYTPTKTEIYKEQLVRYVNYYMPQDLQSGKTPADAMKGYYDTIIKIELLLIEADKLFDAGILYWTEADVEEIQLSVYTAITDSLFETKNTILEDNDLPTIAAKGAEPATGETTYPLPPPLSPEEPENVISPRYDIAYDADNNQWFDAWYTNHQWYIEKDEYKTAYPGLYGEQKDRNLATEAFAKYFEEFAEGTKNRIGISKELQAEIDEEIAGLKEIQEKEGIEYVFPKLGKTKAYKLLQGDSYIKNKKLTKLNEYITKDLSAVTEEDTTKYYHDLLNEQKLKFVTQANYDSAVTNKETLLYYPSDRYVFVKHILLPFSAEQTAQLEKIKAREGTGDKAEARIIAERAKLARQITVYPHVNGEDDLNNPKTVKQVMTEITDRMNFLNGKAFEAERAFDEFIYKYNTDPGIFGSETGYAVVYKLNDGESETYKKEFADAARALRDNFNVGEIFYDEEITDEQGKPVPYCITDYGIHIMYYLMDPVKETKKLNDFVTPGKYSSIYEIMEAGALAAKQADAYDFWEDRYIGDYTNDFVTKKDKVINKYVKEINKQVGL